MEKKTGSSENAVSGKVRKTFLLDATLIKTLEDIAKAEHVATVNLLNRAIVHYLERYNSLKVI
jgi:hypothetical protein